MHFLDVVEVRAVGREKEERGANALDGRANSERLMARQIVHDDHIAATEFGQER